MTIARFEVALQRAQAEYADTLATYTLSSNSADYYFLQYPFDGALSMYEAGGSIAWLDWVVRQSASIIERARPMWDGELGWSWRDSNGAPNRITGDSILCEFQMGRPMLRAVRLASRTPGYRYADEAARVAVFVLEHILGKWLDRRAGLAGGQRPEAVGQDPAVRSAEQKNGWQAFQELARAPGYPWADVWSMAGDMYVQAWLLTGKREYQQRALTLAALFKRRRQVGTDGAWTWDDGVDVGPWSESGGNTSGGPDTGHANREVTWVVHGYLAGLGFDRDDIELLINTLEKRIVRRGATFGFANYLSGLDTPYRNYSFAGSTSSTAAVYDGWARLSWVSPEAASIFETLFDQQQSGHHTSPNDTVWANLELPGHLALAASIHNAEISR
jgi:hypothetical protein